MRPENWPLLMVGLLSLAITGGCARPRKESPPAPVDAAEAAGQRDLGPAPPPSGAADGRAVEDSQPSPGSLDGPARGADAPSAPDGGSPDAPAVETGGPHPAEQPPPAGPGAQLWWTETGSWALGLAFDPQGNIAVGGTAFDNGDGDIALGRYSPQGARLSVRRHGGPTLQIVNDLAVAADGTWVVAGAFEGVTDFGGQSRTAAGDRDAFVAAYDPEGRLKSVISYGSTASDEASGLVIEPTGDWLVGGPCGPLQLGGRRLTDLLATEYLARFAPNGSVRWAREGAGPALALGDSGAAVYGGGYVPLVGRSSSATGQPAWGKSARSGVIAVTDLFLTPTGDLLATGRFSSSVTVEPGKQVTSRGMDDMFLMALSAQTGAVRWVEVVAGGRGVDVGNAVCADRTGHIYVGGQTDSADVVDRPGGLLAKYDAQGRRVWLKSLANSPSVDSLLCDLPDGVIAGLSGALAKFAP
jgi:hypothetical protein